MIVAVDYDGTLECDGKMNEALIRTLNRQQARGDVVVLWTCREGKRLRSALEKLMHAGFRPNYINCNVPQAIRMLGHDPRKIYADVYIDDKNVLWK